MDSVHNDHQRHLPYLWAFPETERQKMHAWGSLAAADGMIQEELAPGCEGPPLPLDQARTLPPLPRARTLCLRR